MIWGCAIILGTFWGTPEFLGTFLDFSQIFGYLFGLFLDFLVLFVLVKFDLFKNNAHFQN